MWAGQQGLKALAAALKRNENKFKNKMKIRGRFRPSSTVFWKTVRIFREFFMQFLFIEKNIKKKFLFVCHSLPICL